MNTIFTGLLCALLACGVARAEKADSLKPINIVANSGVATGDNASTIEGDVVVTKGTLIMKAGKAVTREDPEGYTYATFWAAPGGLATFRQKRDGGDLWVEGEAERIEYDGKLEVVKFFSRARVAQLEGTKVTQQAVGPYISYSSRTEDVAVINSVTGESKKGGGRVEFTFQSKRKPAAAAPAPAPAPAAPSAPAAPAAPAPVTK